MNLPEVYTGHTVERLNSMEWPYRYLASALVELAEARVFLNRARVAASLDIVRHRNLSNAIEHLCWAKEQIARHDEGLAQIEAERQRYARAAKEGA